MIVEITFLILATILALLQATILPINLFYLLIILVSIYQPEFSFLFAFLSGLILDLIQGETLGITSIKLLLITFVTFLVTNKLRIREKRQLKLPSV